MPTAPTAAVCSTERRLSFVFKRSVIKGLPFSQTKVGLGTKKGVLTAQRAAVCSL
jgi:hypothetical protein